MSELDNILNDLILVANGTVRVNFNAKEESKMHVKHLMLRVFNVAYSEYCRDTDNLDSDKDIEDYFKQEVKKL